MTYNSYGEVQTYSARFGTTALYSMDYGTRDGLGRIVTRTETVQGVTHTYGYSYDAVGRLTDVTQDGVATSQYAYDANGNRINGPGLTSSPAYDAQDRLVSYGSCTYAYKLDGSLQTKTCGTATTTYDYDAFGNLRHATLPSGKNIDYLIDGQNRRVGKKVNGALVEGFLYEDDLKRVAWLDSTGAVKAQFVYGTRPNVPEYMVQAGQAYRLVMDQVGSVRLVVNASTGGVAQRIDFDEFGNALTDSAPGFQPFGFAGGLKDPDTGLVRFGGRDYEPATGRWTIKDPLVFGGGDANLYAYVHNEPVGSNDPTGLATYLCHRKLDNLPFEIDALYLFHQYVCTGNDPAGYVCKGLGPKNWRIFNGPGKFEDDQFHQNQCSQSAPDNSCIENCIAGQFADPPPQYSVSLKHGANCQSFAQESVTFCIAICGGAP